MALEDVNYWWIYGYYNLILQVWVLVLAFPVLLIKWWIEDPRRSTKTWAMDVSKQIFGFIVLRTIPAYYIIEGTYIAKNYWLISFMGTIVDGVFVTAFSFFFLIVIQNWSFNWEKLKFITGVYNPYQKLRSWVYQLCIWLFVIVAAKFLVLGIIYFFEAPLYFISYFLLYLLTWNFTFEKVVILIFAPLVTNMIVFYIQVSTNLHKIFGFKLIKPRTTFYEMS